MKNIIRQFYIFPLLVTILPAQSVLDKYGDRIELLGIPFKGPMELCQIFIAIFLFIAFFQSGLVNQAHRAGDWQRHRSGCCRYRNPVLAPNGQRTSAGQRSPRICNQPTGSHCEPGGDSHAGGRRGQRHRHRSGGRARVRPSSGPPPTE